MIQNMLTYVIFAYILIRKNKHFWKYLNFEAYSNFGIEIELCNIQMTNSIQVIYIRREK